MKKLTFAATAGAALTAGFIGLAAPAMAAPGDTSAAEDTISSLRDQGYTVVVNNPNGTPMSDATVTGVRQGPEQVQTYIDAQDAVTENVTQSIVFVDVK